mgnify:CR=1 FL=1
MEKKLNEIAEKQGTGSEGKKITRKQAIKKTGYMAASAATMMILLNENAHGMTIFHDPVQNQNGNGNGDCDGPVTS